MKKQTQKLKIGKPVKPMLVSESGGNEKKYNDIIKLHGESLVEIKSDGNRVQVHKNDDIRLYTRGLNGLNPRVFPELAKTLKEIPYGIFDGELVGVEDGIKGFKAVEKRKKKTLDMKLVKQFPLQIKFFDVLNLEGQTLIDQPLLERRGILENYIENVSEQHVISDPYMLKERFEQVTEELGLEGLVCKKPDSKYLIGKKTKDWIKLKKFLTLDLVVLGIYQGKGKAAELPFAGLLLGTRNNGVYETITKVGISNKKLIEAIHNKIRNSYSEEIPENVIISPAVNKKTYAKKVPFCYIAPEKSAVVEVKVLDITNSKNWHSCGLDGQDKAYSLRIPVIERYRGDKKACDCNTTKQIKELYVK